MNKLIPTYSEYMSAVDPEDIDVLDAVTSVMAIPSNKNKLGRNSNYDSEFKQIKKLIRTRNSEAIQEDGSRQYAIPYCNEENGPIHFITVSVNDEGDFRIGDGKVRQVATVGDSTLKRDIQIAKSSTIL